MLATTEKEKKNLRKHHGGSNNNLGFDVGAQSFKEIKSILY